MNIDINTHTKRLANRIQQYIKKIISQDQAGFNPGQKDWLNTQKLM